VYSFSTRHYRGESVRLCPVAASCQRASWKRGGTSNRWTEL